jgi:hypothetical protein
MLLDLLSVISDLMVLSGSTFARRLFVAVAAAATTASRLFSVNAQGHQMKCNPIEFRKTTHSILDSPCHCLVVQDPVPFERLMLIVAAYRVPASC